MPSWINKKKILFQGSYNLSFFLWLSDKQTTDDEWTSQPIDWIGLEADAVKRWVLIYFYFQKICICLCITPSRHWLNRAIISLSVKNPSLPVLKDCLLLNFVQSANYLTWTEVSKLVLVIILFWTLNLNIPIKHAKKITAVFFVVK